jgi:hypothetical protein
LKQSKGKNEEIAVWVNPSKKFSPVRYFVFDRGVLVSSLEITYSEDKDFGWVPGSWKATQINPQGGITHSLAVKVGRYVLNVAIPDETFDIQLPAGTWVHDYVAKEEFIVREGGGKRPILKGEFNGTNYEELARTGPGATSWRHWVAICLSGGRASHALPGDV